MWWIESRSEGAPWAWSILWPVAWLYEYVAGWTRETVSFVVAQWRWRGDPGIALTPLGEEIAKRLR